MGDFFSLLEIKAADDTSQSVSVKLDGVEIGSRLVRLTLDMAVDARNTATLYFVGNIEQALVAADIELPVAVEGNKLVLPLKVGLRDGKLVQTYD